MLRTSHPRPTQASRCRHGPRPSSTTIPRLGELAMANGWPCCSSEEADRDDPALTYSAPQARRRIQSCIEDVDYRACRRLAKPSSSNWPRQMDRRQTPDRHWSCGSANHGSPARSAGLPRRLLRSLRASQDVRARNRARRRTLPPPVPCSHQGQSPHPRQTRPPQRRSATRPHGKRTDTKTPADHQPTARRQMARYVSAPTFAAPSLDRIAGEVHRLNLDGPSMRKTIAENFNAITT